MWGRAPTAPQGQAQTKTLGSTNKNTIKTKAARQSPDGEAWREDKVTIAYSTGLALHDER